MNDNEILETLRDGCAPFVNLGLQKLGDATAKLAAARIARGELAVRIEVLFGANLCAICQIIDEDGVVAYEFSLEGLTRLVVDGKAN
jgi:hypothetical protein